MVHLGNVGYRLGRKLTSQGHPKFVNDTDAKKALTREP